MAIDNDRAVRLLRTLDSEPHRPSTVDLGRALTDGRRKRRNRRIARTSALAAVAALALAAVPVAASTLDRRGGPRPDVAASTDPSPPVDASPRPPTKCAVDKLQAPDGATLTTVEGADPTGRFFTGYWRRNDSSNPKLLIWTDGKPSEVPVADLDPHLIDVASDGRAVGWGGTLGDGGDTPWSYQNGTLTKLTGASHGSAIGVNDAGVIVGSGGTVNDNGQLLYKPVRWASADASATILPLPAGATAGAAYGIDEDGTIVGAVRSRPAEDPKPYVWLADGTHRYLPLPERTTAGEAAQIRNGWVIGRVGIRTGNEKPDYTPVVWNPRTGETRMYKELSQLSAVNRHGWIVGLDRESRAVLLGDGFRVELPPAPTAPAPPADGLTPRTLSDDGRTIAARSRTAAKTEDATVWRCR